MPSDAFVVDRGGRGRWYVVDVTSKLQARAQLSGASRFDALQSAALHAGDEAARLTVDEALETRLVNSRLTRTQAQRIVAGWNRRRLGHQLGGASTRLEECSPERVNALVPAIEGLMGTHIGVAKVTKVLALKRPALVPMLDRLVYWMVPGADLRAKLHWLHHAACAWHRVTRLDGSTPVQCIEKLLWFDTLFPWVGSEARGTAATCLVPQDWRLIHWPAPPRRRGSATRPGAEQRDGCIAHVPGAPAPVALALDRLARTHSDLAHRIHATVRNLDAAADMGEIAPPAGRRRN